MAQLECSQTATQAPAKGSKPSSGNTGQVTYELMFKPEQARLNQSTRVAQLEQRLHAVETSVGDVPNKLVSTTVPLIFVKLGIFTSKKFLF
jgi:dynactin-2